MFWVDGTNRGKAKIMSLDRESGNVVYGKLSIPTGLTLSNDNGLANTTVGKHCRMQQKCPLLNIVWIKVSDGIGPTRTDLEQMFGKTYNGTAVADATGE